MKDFLAIIGGICSIALIILLIIVVFQAIGELIDRIRRNYQIKHRFDKPPTAECYCRDCTRHDAKTKRCYKFDGWYTADEWFCWDANPRKEDVKDDAT